MFFSYRALLARAGARPLALACALGWLAYTSYGLAIILVVHSSAHSFTVAGGAVAAFSAGSGGAAPARGRFIDRRGPGGLAWFVAAHTGAASALVIACALRAPPPILLGTSAIAGALAPPLIATARAVWGEVAGRELTGSAHALNASLAAFVALPLSAAACGGIVASLWIGSRAGRSRVTSRYLAGSVLAGAVLPLTIVTPTLAGVICISVAAGAGYGILGAALFELLDHVVAPERAVEAFTWLTTGQAAGSAAGAAATGALVHRGLPLAFVFVAGSAGVAAALAIGRRGTLLDV